MASNQADPSCRSPRGLLSVQVGSAGAIDRLSQARVVRWETLCGRLPRFPSLAASDHAPLR